MFADEGFDSEILLFLAEHEEFLLEFGFISFGARRAFEALESLGCWKRLCSRPCS
jgi:hypothetical protein